MKGGDAMVRAQKVNSLLSPGGLEGREFLNSARKVKNPVSINYYVEM